MRRMPHRLTRRDWIVRTGAALAAGAAARPAAAAPRAFTLNLVPGMIGVDAPSQLAVNAFAHRHGFESVEARGGELMQMDEKALEAVLADLREKKLAWGAAGLPTNARVESPKFDEAIRELPRFAAGLRRAGVTRVGTWVSPASDSLTYMQNFRTHVRRVGEVARILADENVRLGLEYIGTPTLRQGRRHAFIHSMAELKELFADVKAPNTGFVLDSWHWFTAGESAADIRTLSKPDVVAVDLNDAPRGVPVGELRDNERELPAATGVIDAGAFLTAVGAIGYDGPVRAEPFNKPLNALPDDEACAKTIAALKEAVSRATF